MLECVKTLLFVAMGVAPVKVSGSGWYLYISRSMVSKTIDRQAHGTRVSYYKSFLECLRANLGAVLFWHTSRLPSKVQFRARETNPQGNDKRREQDMNDNTTKLML